jgi:RDD family
MTIASPWRRVAAGMFDATALLALIALGVFAWSRSERLFRRRTRVTGEARAADAAQDLGPAQPSAASRTVLGGLTIAGVGLRNVRSPGERLLGIRRADARTCGPVSFRSTVIHQVATQLSSAVLRELTRPLTTRQSERFREITQAMDEIRKEHADDPAARQEAVMELYRAKDVHVLRGCLLPLVGPVALNLTAFWSPQHQTVFDRVAGIIVVKE